MLCFKLHFSEGCNNDVELNIIRLYWLLMILSFVDNNLVNNNNNNNNDNGLFFIIRT